MKNLYKKFSSGIIFLLLTHLTFAQWQTHGPFGGPINASVTMAGKLYVGTSNGVFVSSDNGATWSEANQGIKRITIVALATDGTNLYAGGSADGVFFSSNNGASWTPRNSGITTLFITSLFGASDGVYVGTPNGVFFSSNQGMSWAFRNNGIPSTYDMYVYAETTDTVFAGSYGVGLYKSYDHGMNWNVVGNGFPVASSSLNVFVYAIKGNGNDIFAGTSEGVYKSSNRGLTWSLSNTGFPPGMWAKCFAFKPGYIFAGTYSEGVYVSTNNGASWSPTNTGIPDMPFPTGLPHNYPSMEDLNVSGSAVIACSVDGLYRSTNNGASWSGSNGGILGNDILSIVSNGSVAFAASARNGVYTSTNFGTTWNRSNNGLTSWDINAATVSGSSVFVSASYEHVFRSDNNGASWISASSGIPSEVMQLTHDSTRVLALTNGAPATPAGIYQTVDNGLNWTEIPTGFAVSMSTVSSTNTKLYVGTWTGKVMYSNNNGSSWSDISSGLPAVKINSIHISGSNLYAGTDGFGVYKSTNNGASWTAFNSGLGNLYVNDIEQYGSVIYAGTWGGGIYTSSVSGSAWSSYNGGLNDLYVRSLSTETATLYAGTDAGAYAAPFAVLGIETFALQGVEVYPNPSSGLIQLRTNFDQKVSISIINVSGDEVYRYEGNSSEIQNIDLSRTAKGIYLFSLETDKGIARKKLVIQ